MRTALFATALALSLLGAAKEAPAALLGGDPGPVFDMPGPGDGYDWHQDLTGLLPGDTVVEFTVNVPAGGALLKVFQMYGEQVVDGRRTAFRATFGLEVNQAPDTWTDIDYDLYWYHDYTDVHLLEGARTFKVTLTGSEAGGLPIGAGPYARVGFGEVPLAVPLPAAAMLLAGGLAALAGLRRRREPV